MTRTRLLMIMLSASTMLTNAPASARGFGPSFGHGGAVYGPNVPHPANVPTPPPGPRPPHGEKHGGVGPFGGYCRSHPAVCAWIQQQKSRSGTVYGPPR